MMRPRRRYYVLLDHDASHVVAAEAQTQLARLESLGHPGALHVPEAIPADPRDRERLQVLHGGGFFLDETAERGVLPLECPRDECREPAGLFLKIAHQVQMVHPLLD